MNTTALAAGVITAYLQSSVNVVTEESQLLKLIDEVTSALTSLQTRTTNPDD